MLKNFNPHIDLTNPKLGEKLLNDARSDFPRNVWLAYVLQHMHTGNLREVILWHVDPDDPEVAPIDSEQAVDQAQPLVEEVIRHLTSSSPQQALDAVNRLAEILRRGSSLHQPGRGQPPKMQPQAVRAWVILKFNPHPKKPGASTVGWARLADLLFLKDGECPRITHDHKLGREHRHDDPCVKALRTAVGNLKKAMKDAGFPT